MFLMILLYELVAMQQNHKRKQLGTSNQQMPRKLGGVINKPPVNKLIK